MAGTAFDATNSSRAVAWNRALCELGLDCPRVADRSSADLASWESSSRVQPLLSSLLKVVRDVPLAAWHRPKHIET